MNGGTHYMEENLVEPVPSEVLLDERRDKCRANSVVSFVCLFLTLLCAVLFVLFPGVLLGDMEYPEGSTDPAGGFAVFAIVIMLMGAFLGMITIGAFGAVAAIVGLMFSVKALKLVKHLGLRIALIVSAAIQATVILCCGVWIVLIVIAMLG